MSVYEGGDDDGCGHCGCAKHRRPVQSPRGSRREAVRADPSEEKAEQICIRATEGCWEGALRNGVQSVSISQEGGWAGGKAANVRKKCDGRVPCGRCAALGSPHLCILERDAVATPLDKQQRQQEQSLQQQQQPQGKGAVSVHRGLAGPVHPAAEAKLGGGMVSMGVLSAHANMVEVAPPYWGSMDVATRSSAVPSRQGHRQLATHLPQQMSPLMTPSQPMEYYPLEASPSHGMYTPSTQPPVGSSFDFVEGMPMFQKLEMPPSLEPLQGQPFLRSYEMTQASSSMGNFLEPFPPGAMRPPGFGGEHVVRPRPPPECREFWTTVMNTMPDLER